MTTMTTDELKEKLEKRKEGEPLDLRAIEM